MPEPMMAGPEAPPATPPAGPQAAPMAQPTPNTGNAQMGAAQVESAMQLMERALPELGIGTPEHDAVIRALGALAKSFARSKNKELVPAQIMELMEASKTPPIAGMLAGGGASQPAPAMA